MRSEHGRKGQRAASDGNDLLTLRRDRGLELENLATWECNRDQV
jgi:hypothetical protein